MYCLSSVSVANVPITQIQDIVLPCRDIDILFERWENSLKPAVVKVPQNENRSIWVSVQHMISTPGCYFGCGLDVSAGMNINSAEDQRWEFPRAKR